jgi:hypothetical protein
MFKSNWVLDPEKFLSREEVNRLIETARKKAAVAIAWGNKVASATLHLSCATRCRASCHQRYWEILPAAS